MKHLILTGAYGLVGSNICRVLERDYPDIQITKVKFDDLSSCTEADYIIHAAGYGQPMKFTKDKLNTINVNTLTTNELFSFLKPSGRFLYVSTSEIYSGAKPPYKEIDIGTTSPQHPRACYIEGKRCGEAICMAYLEAGTDVRIARLALAYGPGTKKGDTRVINYFIEQALTKKKIEMLDDGSALRTYGYIDDVVEQLLHVLFFGDYKLYNVGGESTISVKGLAEKIGKLTNAEVVVGPKGLEGAPENVCLDLSTLRSEGVVCKVGLDEGLLKTIAYQRTLYV